MKTTIAILIFAAVGLAVAQGPYPIPTLERMPTKAYVAAYEAEQRSNVAASVAFSQAEEKMIALVATNDMANWKDMMAVAKAISAHVDGVKRLEAVAKTNTATRLLMQTYLPTAPKAEEIKR